MKCSFHVVDFYSLARFTRLNIFGALSCEYKCKHLTGPTTSFLAFFLNVFLCIFKKWTRKEVKIPFNGKNLKH